MQEVIVDLGLVFKLEPDLIQVGEGVLDLVAGGKELVEADDEVGVALEEHSNQGDDSKGADQLGFELLKLQDCWGAR